jgi:hypothetical protein
MLNVSMLPTKKFNHDTVPLRNMLPTRKIRRNNTYRKDKNPWKEQRRRMPGATGVLTDSSQQHPEKAQCSEQAEV